MTYFFSQSFPDTKAKLKCLERATLSPQTEALGVAFKVYHGRDKKPVNKKYLMMAKASQLIKKFRLSGLQKSENIYILVTNVVRRVTGSRPVLILINHPDHVQGAIKKSIGVLSVPML